MKRRFIIASIFMIVVGLGGNVQAQRRVTDSGAQLLDECRTLFTQGDFSAAHSLLMEYESAVNSRDRRMSEEIDYMRTVIEAERDLRTATEQIELFLNRYPESMYENRMMALLGSSHFAAQRYDEAIECFDLTDPLLLGDSDCIRLLRHNAISLIRCGRIDEGYLQLGILEQMVDDPEHDSDILFYKAYINYRNGRTEQAVEGFKNSLEGKHADEARLYLADIDLHSDSDNKTAYETAEQMIMESQDPLIEAEAERILGEYWYGKGEYEKSYALFTSYMAMGSSSDMRHDKYLLGMASFKAGHLDDAVRYLQEVSEQEDELAQNAALNLGLAALEQGDKAMARMAFERACGIPGKANVREQALYNYAMINHETSFSPFSESVTSFERFLNEFPHSKYAESVNSYLLDVYLNTNSFDAALNSIAKIANPGQSIMAAKVQLLYNKSMDLIASGQNNEALSALTEAISLERYDRAVAHKAMFWRGEVYYRLNDTDNARADWNRYLAYSDSEPVLKIMASYGMGYIYYNKGAYKDAFGYMRSVIENSRGLTVSADMIADASLRAADSKFYIREYQQAIEYYSMAVNINSKIGDYALYQSGMVNGLQRNYNQKIEDMERLVSGYASSPYVPSALYEEGRAYQQINSPAKAVDVFQRIVRDFPVSELARKASAEIALIYYQTEQYDDAITAYKKVIDNYPGSDEARTALVDLKSIYVEKGDVNSYVEYSAGVKDASPMAVGEQDSLTYASAEGAFSRGEKDVAIVRFNQYLQQYPNGVFASHAWYYHGLLLDEKGEYDKAYESLMHAAAYENSRFCESALDRAATMEWNRKEWESAMDLYIRLYDKTTNAERQQRSLYSIVSCAGRIEEYDAVTMYADKALQTQLSKEKATEVSYLKAKALLALERGGEAREILENLSQDTRSRYGAEADYLLSQLLFDSGDADGAQKVIMEFIQEGTPHTYWLARSFILLSDIYSSQGKDVEARQYLLSLKSNYTEDDDIAQMIEERLD